MHRRKSKDHFLVQAVSEELLVVAGEIVEGEYGKTRLSAGVSNGAPSDQFTDEDGHPKNCRADGSPARNEITARVRLCPSSGAS